MADVLKLAIFAVIVLGAAIVIWRGMRTPPDDTANKARGGGADSHHIGPHQ